MIAAKTLAFDTLKVVEKIKLLENGVDTLPHAELSIEFIYPKSYGSKADLKKLQSLFYQIIFDEENESVSSPHQAIERYIKSYTEEYRDEASDYSHDYSQYSQIDNEIDFYNKSLLSFTSNFENVHSGKVMREIKYSVIDLKSMKKLTEADMFKPGYEEPLAQIIRNKLLEAAMEWFEDVGIDQNPRNSFDDFDAIHANGNFKIDDKGLHYMYNQNEVARAIFGAFEIDIALKEVAHLFNLEVLNDLGINGEDDPEIAQDSE